MGAEAEAEEEEAEAEAGLSCGNSVFPGGATV